jgi:hypothetical protein
MHRIRKVVWLPFMFILAMIPIGSPQAQPPMEDRDEQGTVLVGRISHVEGQLLRYVPDEEDWVVTVRDAPFGIDDALYSSEDGRAEFIMPNNTWVRIDRDTRIQLFALKDDVTEIDVASGVARFYNKSSYGVIKATTLFGYVMAPAETSFDLYVGDDSVEVIALKGTLDFVHHTSETRYEVIAGSTSILADIRQVTAGKGDVDPDWDRWNREGDALWAERMEVKGTSVEYLPPGLHHEAYIFEEHGRWENVYYEGAYYYFWRPIHIGVGWAPFTVGRWTLWYGDHTWIPYEPFGYVTHHYGNWVLVRNCWYWAPPLARVRPHLRPPLLDVGSAWYPGRVAWIHYGTRIGWVPLGPREPYYCHRRWGPRAVVFKNVNITNLNINRYRHFKRAVIINRHHLYSVNNYRNVRIRHTNNDTILKRYRVVPVVDNRVINNYKNTRQRYNFTNVNVRRKPDRPVIKRIHRKHLVTKQGVNPKARKIRQKVSNTRRGRLAERVGAKTARVQNRLISANRVSGSVSQRKQKELKSERRLQEGNQRRAVRKLESVPRRLPPKPVKRQEAKQEDPRHARKYVQSMQQRRKPPGPVTRQEVRPDNQKRAARKPGKVQKSTRLPGPDQQLESVDQGYRKRQEPRKTRQDRQIRVSEPGQENSRRDVERQKNVMGWNSQRYFPSRQVTGRPGSTFGSGKKY